jgi:SAM-dependent methyltransferase
MMVDWDKRYSEAREALFGDDPNNYVIQTIARPDFQVTSALCLADGDGRNGRYLAKRGIQVTAVELSGVATGFARAKDQSAGVRVERVQGDLAEWAPREGRVWEAVFLIYLHCDREVRQRAVELAGRHLLPGGWFVAEGFAANTVEGPRMGPSDPALLYDPGEFDRWLADFYTVERLTGFIALEEGAKHRGLAQVVRWTGRKR